MKPYVHVCFVVLAAGLAGCSASPTTELDLARRREAIQSPLLTPEQREAVSRGRILPGMTEEMVAASWGVPRRVDSRHDSGQSLETWDFGPREGAPFGARLTFESGVLARLERARSSELEGVAGLALPATATSLEGVDLSQPRRP